MKFCIDQILTSRKQSKEKRNPCKEQKIRKTYVKELNLITIDGIAATKKEHCKRYKTSMTTINSRIYRLKITFEEALKFVSVRYPVYTVNGITSGINEHLVRIGINRKTYSARLKANGGNVIDALSRDNKFKLVEAFGEMDTITGHSKRHGLHSSLVFYRMNKKGMTLEEAIKFK